ncbi:hypothetical protein CQW23_19463 [Capsicum baccatum]|uniref:Uncharacterized protein n=1 Tax=Capsicum baccatum TaxID=33114 RepID=A0A2G2W5Y1_CAPBA|nr:hypothetical protein CQW23_19463 [Capsicum baccatum]
MIELSFSMYGRILDPMQTHLEGMRSFEVKGTLFRAIGRSEHTPRQPAETGAAQVATRIWTVSPAGVGPGQTRCRKMTTDSQVHDAATIVAVTSVSTTSRTNAPLAMAPAEKPKKFLGFIVNEVFQVAAIIEKLPPMRKDFKNYLKHKRMEMSFEDLIIRLGIEEDNKATESRSKENSAISGANIVEDDKNNSKNWKKDGHESNPRRNSRENTLTVARLTTSL